MLIDTQFGKLVEPLGPRTWEQGEIARQVALRAGRLERLGVVAGDRVFLVFGNSLEFFAELIAIWDAGACAIPVDARLTAFEVENLARVAIPKLAIIDASTDEKVISVLNKSGIRTIETTDTGETTASTHRLRLDDDALLLFTSGSTGDPKGVVHTHRSLRARWIGLRDHLPARAFARSLCMLPTHFGHGLICNALFPWLSGNDLYITPPFRPDLVARMGGLIDQHDITFMSSVPPIWKLALKLAKPPQKGTLERVHVGSAPLSAQAWEDIRKWTGTRNVCNAYGITETGSWVAGLENADVRAEDGLVGVGWGSIIKVLTTSETTQAPTRDLECPAGEAGYIWLSTPALMKGYFGRDDLTSNAVVNGWFMTGDIGLIDDEGRLVLRGRERDEINKGGLKIYPSDIEAVVERHAAASDVCAFALDDSIYGQAVGMAVVLTATSDENVRDLHEWMKSHLAEHKLPSRWWSIDAIPRTSRGKVNRDQVRAACEKQAALDLPSILAGRRT